ncbi:hypothetical protein HMPREF1214_02487 [Bacteroides sp. HPS0048]|uniref:hypothetical protein n=1 Tax=Bacteroides sp. HPS0048 TaxID=1078089 RepID=UPI00037F30AB|nr:hypothetical protein [Bacteroides sp. HPS0048]EOA57454.1 hypothetical protein HMPREF1214_02487 [Bacteroides sp. HPS0048]
MKLNKRAQKRIERQAARYKQMFEAHCPEVDKIVAELKKDAKDMPKNMTHDEEIAYILKKSNGEDDFEKLTQKLEIEIHESE